MNACHFHAHSQFYRCENGLLLGEWVAQQMAERPRQRPSSDEYESYYNGQHAEPVRKTIDARDQAGVPRITTLV